MVRVVRTQELVACMHCMSIATVPEVDMAMLNAHSAKRLLGYMGEEEHNRSIAKLLFASFKEEIALFRRAT